MSPDQQADFRRSLARYATGVTVITTTYEGVDHAMTANSFTSVSLEPLLVLVCVERDTRFHEAVYETGRWGVSVLAADQRRHAVWFATRGRPLEGQFLQVPYTRGEYSGAPLLGGAVTTLECRTTDCHPAGDHDVLIGEVLTLGPIAVDKDPLLYWGSEYRLIGGHLETIPGRHVPTPSADPGAGRRY
jgi:flavin reductase (DIM6/NTAB) family NADH-FMN oxidoreductase RutF